MSALPSKCNTHKPRDTLSCVMRYTTHTHTRRHTQHTPRNATLLTFLFRKRNSDQDTAERPPLSEDDAAPADSTAAAADEPLASVAEVRAREREAEDEEKLREVQAFIAPDDDEQVGAHPSPVTPCKAVRADTM